MCADGRIAGRGAELTLRRINMGKYFIAWLLGVPAFVLLIVWFFFR